MNLKKLGIIVNNLKKLSKVMEEKELIYFKNVLGDFSASDLNETFVINLVKEHYDNIDFKNYNAEKFIWSVGLLEYYLKHNFLDFTITEDIYRFAKHICEMKIGLLNKWRSTPTYKTFEEWLVQNKYINQKGYCFFY